MSTSIKELVQAPLPTHAYGLLTLRAFQAPDSQAPHLAIIKEPTLNRQSTLVRVHSECLTGDLLDSARCDCGWQLHESLKRIATQGGVLLYLRQEGRGIGLINKLRAYQLQDQGLDTVEANRSLGFGDDERDYEIGAEILGCLGLKHIRLLTNNPRKVDELTKHGIEVIERLALVAPQNPHNQTYLATKQTKLGHLLGL